MTPGLVLLTMALGALGALARYALHYWGASAGRGRTAIVVVNVLGSTVAGVLVALPESPLTLPLIVGLCGSLTTVSTMVMHLLPVPGALTVSRRLVLASAHIAGSVAGCFLGFGLGVLAV
jgi:fluoride ion exporter CrcB/FEX